MGEHSGAGLIWPNMALHCEPHLRWLVEHQDDIVRAFSARRMTKPRPVKVWPDGRVRIEFVKTFPSSLVASEICAERIYRWSQARKASQAARDAKAAAREVTHAD